MALGPIDLLVLGFPTDRLTGKVAEAIAELVHDGTIRLVDAIVAMRNDSGDLTVVEVDELGEDIKAAFQVSASELKGSLTEEDAHTMAGNLAPGKTVGLFGAELGADGAGIERDGRVHMLIAPEDACREVAPGIRGVAQLLEELLARRRVRLVGVRSNAVLCDSWQCSRYRDHSGQRDSVKLHSCHLLAPSPLDASIRTR